jgi:hypothetical protein
MLRLLPSPVGCFLNCAFGLRRMELNLIRSKLPITSPLLSPAEVISNLGQMIWLLVAFGWGMVHILWDLSQEGSLVGHWIFGQVVAVVLLAAPFITMM